MERPIPNRLPDPYTVGLKWDSYTPAVEAQVTRDLIALNHEATKWPNTCLQVACESNEADRLLATLGIIRTSIASTATLWRTYQVGAKRVTAPSNAKKVVAFVLFQKPTRSNMLRKVKDDKGYALKEQGRDWGFNPFDRPPPSSNTSVGTKDPLVTMVWT